MRINTRCEVSHGMLIKNGTSVDRLLMALGLSLLYAA